MLPKNSAKLAIILLCTHLAQIRTIDLAQITTIENLSSSLDLHMKYLFLQ